MLTIPSSNGEAFCDGHTRRGFLRIGSLGLAGAMLPPLLQAEAQNVGKARPHKALINIFLAGGPPHQDMFDLKMDAPSEIRGEFKPIATNVDGIEICELFPQLAKMMDKFSVIRSMVGAHGGHDAIQCLTGRTPRGPKLQGQVHPSVPSFLGLSPKCGHDEWGDPGKPGFLGPSHAAFAPFRGGGKDDMLLDGISLERLQDRKALLGSFDRFRRDVDSSGAMEGMDAFTEQAFGVLTSSRLADAFDLSKEDPKTVERYGKGTEKLTADGPWKRLDQFLMARRLIEAGARCVTLGFSRWDWHSGNFKRAREDFPLLDQGVSALMQDLVDRGMDKDVTVVVWGEFGRTPKINPQGGRDHWPKVSCALVGGGGMNNGQVIGATTRDGGEASERPVEFQEVFSTLYHNLGIDARRTTIDDLTGRPRYLIENQFAPLPELVG